MILYTPRSPPMSNSCSTCWRGGHIAHAISSKLARTGDVGDGFATADFVNVTFDESVGG
jgi:hypothetical protein